MDDRAVNIAIFDADHKQKLIPSILNILWIFLSVQVLAIVLVVNLSLLFPKIIPPRHPFVIDSGEYIEELYYYGSGPTEVDEHYLKEQWYRTDTDVG